MFDLVVGFIQITNNVQVNAYVTLGFMLYQYHHGLKHGTKKQKGPALRAEPWLENLTKT